MTNLYQQLKSFLDRAQSGPAGLTSTLNQDDLKWLRDYLASPDHYILFKAKATGKKNGAGDPEYAQDYELKGSPDELFGLLCEAMFQNPTFKSLVFAANAFFIQHVPKCPHCNDHHPGQCEDHDLENYNFPKIVGK